MTRSKDSLSADALQDCESQATAINFGQCLLQLLTKHSQAHGGVRRAQTDPGASLDCYFRDGVWIKCWNNGKEYLYSSTHHLPMVIPDQAALLRLCEEDVAKKLPRVGTLEKRLRGGYQEILKR